MERVEIVTLTVGARAKEGKGQIARSKKAPALQARVPAPHPHQKTPEVPPGPPIIILRITHPSGI